MGFAKNNQLKTTGMMFMMLNQSMSASIYALSGSNNLSFQKTEELLNGGPLALFFSKILAKNNQLISINQSYIQVRQYLEILEYKIGNIDFDKIQMESNAENRSKRIIDHAGKVDEINQSIIEITEKLNGCFTEFHHLISENIKLNQVFIEDYLTTIEKIYEEATQELSLDFKVDNRDVFDISRIKELRIFSKHHGINIDKIEKSTMNEHMIIHFGTLQVFIQIEYNKVLARSIHMEETHKKSFSSVLFSSIKSSDESKVQKIVKTKLSEFMEKHQDYLAVCRPNNREILKDLQDSFQSLRLIDFKLNKYPQKIASNDSQDSNTQISIPKSSGVDLTKVQIPNNIS